jgi:hypothetical protein
MKPLLYFLLAYGLSFGGILGVLAVFGIPLVWPVMPLVLIVTLTVACFVFFLIDYVLLDYRE